MITKIISAGFLLWSIFLISFILLFVFIKRVNVWLLSRFLAWTVISVLHWQQPHVLISLTAFSLFCAPDNTSPLTSVANYASRLCSILSKCYQIVCSLPIPFCLSLTPAGNGGNGSIFSHGPHHAFFFPRLIPTLLFPPVAASHAFLRVLMRNLLVLFSHAFSAHVFAFWLVRSSTFIAIVLFDVLVSTFQICLNTPYCLHFWQKIKKGKHPWTLLKGQGTQSLLNW